MKLSAILLSATVICGCGSVSSEEVKMPDFYDIKVSTIDGEAITMGKYKGKVLLIVNTASKCGFTRQYDGLQKLYAEYKDKGLVILGFPSNDFMRQEPGSDSEISNFCRVNYGVEFPMFAKIKVKGDDQHILYKWLTSEKTNPDHAGKISWNFNKFLISREGKVLNRFGSRTEPQDPELVKALEAALETKAGEKKDE